MTVGAGLEMKRDPMDEWVLRDEILAAFHRWPMILVFILVGSLLGLAFAFLWPPSYRANIELSIQLNPYRALDDLYVPEFTKVEFRNVDDYKHWQMSQLSILVSSDNYLQETLNRLRKIDTYWNSIEVPELRQMINAQWRNAGIWLLSAEAESGLRASEVIETWRDVILEFTDNAISNSRELFQIEISLRSLNNELVELQLNQSALEEIKGNLNEIAISLRAAKSDELISQADRTRLFNLVNQTDFNEPGWQLILEDSPDPGSPSSEYLNWVERASGFMDQKIDSNNMSAQILEDEISRIYSEWEAGLRSGQGLSATLSLANVQDDQPQVKQVRSYSLAALVGAIMGLLVWFLGFLAKITRKGYQ